MLQFSRLFSGCSWSLYCARKRVVGGQQARGRFSSSTIKVLLSNCQLKEEASTGQQLSFQHQQEQNHDCVTDIQDAVFSGFSYDICYRLATR